MVRVACVQMRAGEPGDRRTTADRILGFLERSAREGAELVVFPEAAYPAYYIGPGMDRARTLVAESEEFLDAVSRKARSLGVYVAIGVLCPEWDGRISNSAFLIDPEGMILAQARKNNMWHFDSRYVCQGHEYPVVPTPLGVVGLMVCADGRAPEIARILALKGADIILDLANLTGSGSLSNPQVEYMLPARARENAVWLVVADKVGLESKTVLNCGSSRVIDPWGRIAASLDAREEAILHAAIDVSLPRPTLPPRHPERYSLLVSKRDPLPRRDLSPYRELLCGIVQYPFRSGEEYGTKAKEFLEILQDQGYSVICLPRLEPDGSHDDVVRALLPYIDDGHLVVFGVSGKAKNCGVTFISSGGVNAVFGGNDAVKARDTPLLRCGALFGDEGFVPEAARCLMLDGAEVVFWYDTGHDQAAELLARTRAAENRVYFVRMCSISSNDSACIVAPNGNVIASTVSGEEMATGAMITPVLSSMKIVVPGTDVVGNRFPEDYRVLADVSS